MKKPILHFDESNMAGYDWSWTFFLNKTIDGRFTVSAKQTVCEDGAIRIPARRGLRDGVDVYGALYAIVDGALELQQSLKPLGSSWWIILKASETKEKRADERKIDALLLPWLQNYLDIYRPILAKGRLYRALWLSSNDGRPMSYSGVERAVYHATEHTIGKRISPHLFRTAGASTAAVYAGDQPHLATALLHHTNPEVAQEHYNRASTISAAQSYAALLRSLR